MSTVCSGNPSVPNTGIATSMFIDAAYIRSLLPPVLAYLYPFIPMIHGLEIGDVPTFCATDPPTLGLPDSDDFFNFVTGGPIGTGQIVNDFLKDVARHYLWYEICHCTIVSTPAPPTPPADPGDLPGVNPPTVVTQPNTVPCATLGPTPHTLINGSGAFNRGGLTVRNTTIRTVKFTVENRYVSGTGFAIQSVIQALGPPGSPVTLETFNTGIGATSTKIYSVPLDNTYTGFQMLTNAVGGSGEMEEIKTWEGYCGGAIPGESSPCCPPDPALTGYLHQILSLVTLIQRQSVPFAYVPGASHTGLTGQGELSVSGLIGAKIEITDSNVFDIGVSDGQPDVLFTNSWINWGSADGYRPLEQLRAASTLSLPTACGACTKLAYSLAPGVEATILELVREP